MSFVFQQPGTSPLLDAIEDQATGCQVMGGMFAFATKAGIALFLDLPEISALIARGGRIKLIVGLDAITNGEALLYLRERIEQAGGRLEVRAYLHPWTGTFHPKYTWFKTGNLVSIIAGSGNLTPSGLGCPPSARQNGNWEAFLVQQLDAPGSRHFLDAVQEWLTRSTDAGFLLEVDDPRVLARGAANSRMKMERPPRESRGPRTPNADAPPAIIPWPLPPGAAAARLRPRSAAAAPRVARSAPRQRPVVVEENDGPDAFIREISRNRPGQADVGQEGLRFFGFSNNAASSVLMQYVGLNNIVEPPVRRELFVNASVNYRVELPQIAELQYDVGPNGERMILVAVRLDKRTFRYSIIPVAVRGYSQLSAYLGTQSVTRAGRMREAFVDSIVLAKRWTSGPRNLFPITMVSTEI